VSLERRAPGVWIIAAIIAAATAGCALENGAPGENTQAAGADLVAAPTATEVPRADSLGERQVVPGAVQVEQVPPTAPVLVETAPEMLKGSIVPGLDEAKDDPRPHPWDPAPATNTQDGSGTAGNGK
jgi:hypothetical protein